MSPRAPGDDVIATRGDYLCISPMEAIHALLLKVADDVDQAADLDVLKVFRNIT